MNAVFVSLLLVTVATGTNAADLCSTNNGGCSAQATCSSNFGLVSCACNPGYSGDGKTCLQNIAFGKAALGISTYQSDLVGLALDGNSATIACTDTDATKLLTSWWAVDLGSVQTISVVSVTNDVTDYTTTNMAGTNAVQYDQWASSAAASSTYNWLGKYYPADRMTGANDVSPYGDSQNAWRAWNKQQVDTIELSYAEVVFPNGMDVYETVNPGAISDVSLLNDNTQTWTSVYTAKPAKITTGRIFSVPISQQTFPCKQIRIKIDTTTFGSDYTEIDAVKLKGKSLGHRLDNFKVGVSNTAPTTGKSITDFTQCQQYSGAVTPGGTYNILCPTGTSARYVIVQSSHADGSPICLSDVAVLGAIPTLGCFVELTTRDMNADSTTDTAMTIETCISYCRTGGYLYAGAQNANACYCDNKYGNYGKSAGCNKPCAGNFAQICGGTTSSSVYPTGLVTQTASGTDTTAAALTCTSPTKIGIVNAKYAAGTTCKADKKSSVVNSCQGQTTCSVTAAYSPDPCVGLSPKSLVVQYFCYTALTVSAVDGKSLPITCDSSKKIKVYDGLWGASATCMSDHTTDVRTSCQGKSSCSLTVGQGYTPDPCSGTVKTLTIHYNCL